MTNTDDFDDNLLHRLRQEAAQQGISVSELVEALLRDRALETARASKMAPELPQWRSGGSHVDVSDRDALLDAMGGMAECPPPKS